MDESLKRLENFLGDGGRWMVVEFLGHHKLAGFVTEVSFCGQVCMRLDIPTGVNTDTGKLNFTTQLYGTHALYCATPVNESDAIHLAKQLRPAPFTKYDLHREANRNLDSYEFKEGFNEDIPF